MELESPETFPENRARIGREVRDALKYGGIHIANQALVDELVDVVVSECMELRERIANRIIAPLIGRYENGLSDLQLETLAMVVEYHYETDTGTIDIAFDPTDPPAKR